MDTSLTMVLLKLLTLPRLIPVKRKAKRRRSGLPVKIINVNPKVTKEDKNTMDLFLPRYIGSTPATNPEMRFPTEWAEISDPLSVSDRLYSKLIIGKSDPMIMAKMPLTKNT